MAAAAKVKQEFSPFAIEILKAHNEFRRNHGVPDLKLNHKLCKFAHEWADKCAKDAKMEHRSKCPYGENIFYSFSTDASHTPSAHTVVKAWYDEIKNHKFGEEKVNEDTLHFSQVVWKDTKELGVGISKNKKGQFYVVAYYEPKGNYIGKFVENVPKPKSRH